MGKGMSCEKCGKLLPGVEEAMGSGLYAVDAGLIKRRPEQNVPGFFGGQYECPACGATYTLLLMPFSGDPSPATAVYGLRIVTDSSED